MPPFGSSLVSGPNTQLDPNLDGPPPLPPTGASPVAPGVRPGQGPGVSPLVPSPEVMAIQGLAMLEKGSQLLASVLPGLAPIISSAIERLRDTVPQALSELAATGSSMPAGAGGPGPGAPPRPAPPLMSPAPAAGIPGGPPGGMPPMGGMPPGGMPPRGMPPRGLPPGMPRAA
jgi:hypothetical protein